MGKSKELATLTDAGANLNGATPAYDGIKLAVAQDPNKHTVAQFGNADTGVMVTCDNPIITSGAYYQGGWNPTNTSATLVDFAGGGFHVQSVTGQTVGTPISSWRSHLKVDASGYVTTPYGPAFTATGSSSWVNSVGVLPFGTVWANRGNHFSSGSYQFTCPVAGFYSVSATVLMSTTGGGHTYIRKNGAYYSDIAHGTASAASEYNHCGSTIALECAAGDVFDVYLANTYDGYGIYMGQQYSNFSAHLIG